MEYKLNMGVWGRVFAVPDCIADKYLKLARGSDLKVILYLLHNNSKRIDNQEIAAALELSTDTVEEAFIFWEQVGLISKDGQILNDSCEPQKIIEQKSVPVQKEKVKQTSTITISPREIASRVEECEEIKFLFQYAENFFQHMLTNTEQRSLIWIHDYLGIPADVIIMLFEYCKTIGKMNVKYMERVAVGWQENDILTHEQAENEIKRYIDRHTLASKVMSAFGISRKLSSKEETFIKEWTEKNYDIELISLAYDRTIDSINKLSFSYINSILNGWYEKGLTSTELIKINDDNYSKEKNAKQHSYDIDKYDSLALNISNKNGG